MLGIVSVWIWFYFKACTRHKNKADKLSRRLDWKVSIEKNNKNQTLIKEQWIYRLTEVGLEVDIIEKIKIAKSKNKEIIKVIEEIKKVEIKIL